MMEHAKLIEGQKVVVIGGSAGSIPVINKILCSLPITFQTPIILCVHRMKNESEGMIQVFSKNCKLKTVEPFDKEPICLGKIYLAPSNYHLIIDYDFTFSLSTDIPVNYSRPSIDVTFESASRTFKNNLIGILLTGANTDGAAGMDSVYKMKGSTIVQNPIECAVPVMPLSAIERNCVNHIMNTSEITNFLINL